jgi:hypothetical protein
VSFFQAPLLADPLPDNRVGRWKLAALAVFVVTVVCGCVFSVDHLHSSAESAKRNEITQLLLSRSVAH